LQQQQKKTTTTTRTTTTHKKIFHTLRDFEALLSLLVRVVCAVRASADLLKEALTRGLRVSGEEGQNKMKPKR
jgi:hypothetical protein